MPSEIRIHVIDDDEAVRDSLGFLLETSDLPAKTYDSAAAFLAFIGAGGAGCVVTDMRMPEMGGLELLQEIRGRGLDLPVILITGHGDVPLAVESIRAGAFDYLEKPFAEEQLLDSIRRALARSAADPRHDEQAAARASLAGLSAFERSVLAALVAGAPNKAIAEQLGADARAIEACHTKVMAKMRAGGFADLVRLTLLAGDGDD